MTSPSHVTQQQIIQCQQQQLQPSSQPSPTYYDSSSSACSPEYGMSKKESAQQQQSKSRKQQQQQQQQRHSESQAEKIQRPERCSTPKSKVLDRQGLGQQAQQPGLQGRVDKATDPPVRPPPPKEKVRN